MKLNARTREQAERTLRLMLDQTAAADSCEETESTLTATTSATDRTSVTTCGGNRGASGGSLGPEACGGSVTRTDRGCGDEEGGEGCRERGLVVDGKTLV